MASLFVIQPSDLSGLEDCRIRWFSKAFHGCSPWQSIGVTAIIFIITGVLDLIFFLLLRRKIDAFLSVTSEIFSYVLSVCGF